MRAEGALLRGRQVLREGQAEADRVGLGRRAALSPEGLADSAGRRRGDGARASGPRPRRNRSNARWPCRASRAPHRRRRPRGGPRRRPPTAALPMDSFFFGDASASTLMLPQKGHFSFLAMLPSFDAVDLLIIASPGCLAPERRRVAPADGIPDLALHVLSAVFVYHARRNSNSPEKRPPSTSGAWISRSASSSACVACCTSSHSMASPTSGKHRSMKRR